MESVNQILKTTNYDLFKSIDGNRRLNLLNVKKIKKSMEIVHLQVPIIINAKYQIIDGQHRFEAAKQLGLPIYYIINHNYGLSEVHRLNMIGKNWTFYDYLDGYADAGIKDYVEARKFYRKYGFGSNEMLSLLLGFTNVAGGDNIQNFRNGFFKIKDLSEATRKAEMISSLKPFYDGYKKRGFVTALIILFSNKDFDFNVFLTKLSYQRDKLYDCANSKQYILRIEDIYNYKNRDKVRFL